MVLSLGFSFLPEKFVPELVIGVKMKFSFDSKIFLIFQWQHDVTI